MGGGYSQVRAEYTLLKAAVQNGGYRYFHLMSGQDLPLKSQDEIHSFFEANDGKEFVRFYSETFQEEDRVQYHWFAQDLIGRGNQIYTYPIKLLMRAAVGAEKRLHVKRHKNIAFQKGSNWFSITNELAEYVLSQESWVDSVFRNTYCCDEVFLQTLVLNSRFQERLYWGKFDNDMHAIMRLSLWKGSGPKVFTMRERVLIEQCDYLFGRKFDWETDSEIIKHLCHRCLGKAR